jgi:hypothetical protein
MIILILIALYIVMIFVSRALFWVYAKTSSKGFDRVVDEWFINDNGGYVIYIPLVNMLFVMYFSFGIIINIVLMIPLSNIGTNRFINWLNFKK